jgi:hypothetical protein
MDKLEKRIREVAEEDAAIAAETVAATAERNAVYMAGAIAAAGRIADAISAETIRLLERFAEEKMYRHFGFDNIRAFLDESPYSPMSAHQYYERRQVLAKEGDALYDLLSGLGVAINRRKKLGAGAIELDGDNVIIHLPEGDEVIGVDDRQRIIATLSALADSNAAKQREIERQSNEIRSLTRSIRDVYAEADKLRDRQTLETLEDSHSFALVELLAAFERLAAAASNLSEADRLSRREIVFEKIADKYATIREVYGLPPLSAIPAEGSNNDEWQRRFENIDAESELVASL